MERDREARNQDFNLNDSLRSYVKSECEDEIENNLHESSVNIEIQTHTKKDLNQDRSSTNHGCSALYILEELMEQRFRTDKMSEVIYL